MESIQQHLLKYCCLSNNNNILPSLQHPRCCGGHTVDAPVGVAVLVADGDGEPAVIGPDDLKT